MVNLHLFLQGLIHAITPVNLLTMIVALAAGIVVGTLPGLTATMAVALLVPLTFTMSSSTGLLMLGAIYTGAIYGGANAAILINTPGTPSAVATTFDGFAMTKRGRAPQAMLGALTSAVLGGLIGTLFLLFVAKPLSLVALSFGPTQVFWLAIFGLSTIGSMTSGNSVKGLIAAAIGLALAMIGEDPIRGFPRFTYGISDLISGINLIPAMIGFFSLSQLLNLAATGQSHVAHYDKRQGVVREVLGYTFRKCKTIVLRSSLIGTFVGVLPGAGGEIAGIISYNESRRWSKTPEIYGTGVIEGVLASESAANATVGGSLVPLLTLGIPGSSVAAVLMGGLLSHGLIPGAKFLSQNGNVAYTFMVGLVLAQLLMFFVGYVMLRLLVKSLSIRIEYIISIVAVLSVIGSYSISGNMIDVIVMFAFGVLGFFFMKIGLDPGPLVLGLILGSIVERGFVQGLLISHQTSVLRTFFFQPVDAILVLLVIASIASPLFLKRTTQSLRPEFAEEAASQERDPVSSSGTKSTRGFMNSLKTLKGLNLVFAGLVIIWTVYLFLQTLGMPSVSSHYPRVIFYVMIILSVILVVQTVWNKIPNPTLKPFAGVRWRPVFYVILATAALTAGMAYIGFYVSAFVVMILLTLALGKKSRFRVIKAIALSAVTTGLVYLVFWTLLSVSMPMTPLI